MLLLWNINRISTTVPYSLSIGGGGGRHVGGSLTGIVEGGGGLCLTLDLQLCVVYNMGYLIK